MRRSAVQLPGAKAGSVASGLSRLTDMNVAYRSQDPLIPPAGAVCAASEGPGDVLRLGADLAFGVRVRARGRVTDPRNWARPACRTRPRGAPHGTRHRRRYDRRHPETCHPSAHLFPRNSSLSPPNPRSHAARDRAELPGAAHFRSVVSTLSRHNAARRDGVDVRDVVPGVCRCRGGSGAVVTAARLFF